MRLIRMLKYYFTRRTDMFCKNCGQEIPEGVKFCGNCGTPVAVQAPEPQPAPAQQPQYQAPQQQYQAAPQQQYQAPQPQYQQPQYQQPVYAAPAAQQEQPNLLVLGILSLVFCSLGLPGLIIGAIGRSKGKKFVQAGGTLTGASKVGYILSLIGLIFGIIMTIFWVIYIIVVIIAFAARGSSYYSSVSSIDLSDIFD